MPRQMFFVVFFSVSRQMPGDYLDLKIITKSPIVILLSDSNVSVGRSNCYFPKATRGLESISYRGELRLLQHSLHTLGTESVVKQLGTKRLWPNRGTIHEFAWKLRKPRKLPLRTSVQGGIRAKRLLLRLLSLS
jgi:hypothetical protein